MRKSLIVAMDENRLIGAGGDLPWHLSADLRRFKKITMGHPIIMGRKTFASIPKPLPGRVSIVLSRQQLDLPIGDKFACQLASSIEQAFALAETCYEQQREFGNQQPAEAFVIGGSEIYALALPHIDKLYITHVENAFAGDTWFPEVDWNQWQSVAEQRVTSDDFEFPYRFCEYERK